MIVPAFLTQDTDGWLHFTGHRVGLESIVHLYSQGYSPEMLASEYPTLSLADIHKALAFYLEHRSDIDRYVSSCESELDKYRAAAQSTPSLQDLRQRVEATRSVESA